MIWAQQAIDALLALKQAADAARGHAIDPELAGKQSAWFRYATSAGIVLNAARRGKLQCKRALAARMLTRRDDYLRFANDLRVPFDNTTTRPSRSSG